MAEESGEVGQSEGQSTQLKMGGQLLVELSTGSYTSPSTALKEYVSNGWDAGADEITIRLFNPDDADRAAFEIEDNGCGMTKEDLVDKFFRIGRNRREEEGKFVETIRGERRVHGRKGLGNLAGLKLANEMEVITWTTNTLEGARLNYREIQEDPNEAPVIHWFEPDEKPSDSPHGTLIRLREFSRERQYRDDILVRNLRLWFEFGDEAEVRLERREGEIGDSELIDEEVIGRSELFEDIDVQEEELDVTWREDGEEVTKQVNVRWGWLDESNTNVESLISIFSGTRALSTEETFNIQSGFTNMFGIYKLVAEFEADWIDGMEGVDPADLNREGINWGAHRGLQALREVGENWVKETCRNKATSKEGKSELRKRTNDLVEDREEFESWSNQEKDQLVDLVTDFAADEGYATSEINRLIDLFAFVMNHGALMQFIQGLQDGDDQDLDTFLDVANRFNSSEIIGLLQVAKSKLEIIQELQELIADSETTEVPVEGKDDITTFLAKNPWVFDPELRIDHKDISIKKIVLRSMDVPEETLNKLPTAYFDKRPDFVGYKGPSNQRLCVELKRPTHEMNEEEAQRVLRYRASLREEWPDTDTLVVSGSFRDDAKQLLGSVDDIQLMEFTDLFERAEKQMREYIEELEEGLAGLSATTGPAAKTDVDVETPTEAGN